MHFKDTEKICRALYIDLSAQYPYTEFEIFLAPDDTFVLVHNNPSIKGADHLEIIFTILDRHITYSSRNLPKLKYDGNSYRNKIFFTDNGLIFDNYHQKRFMW